MDDRLVKVIVQDINQKTGERVYGKENPSDCVTRCLSYKQLQWSNFLVNINLNVIDCDFDGRAIIIPNPLTLDDSTVPICARQTLKNQEGCRACGNTEAGRGSGGS